jgi:transcriptional regulator with XRE-family HTH domain
MIDKRTHPEAASGTCTNDLGRRTQTLRKRCGLSIRKLAERSGVSAGMISCIERNKTSPSIVTLEKLLAALGTDLARFFTEGEPPGDRHVIPREQMRMVSDAERCYTIVLPASHAAGIVMLDERIYPGHRPPAYESLKGVMVGYVLGGELALDVKGEGGQVLRPGDAFAVDRQTEHRGYAAGEEPVRLVTVFRPDVAEGG